MLKYLQYSPWTDNYGVERTGVGHYSRSSDSVKSDSAIQGLRCQEIKMTIPSPPDPSLFSDRQRNTYLDSLDLIFDGIQGYISNQDFKAT